MQILIRAATAQDFDELCTLYDEVDKLHREHMPALFQEPDGSAGARDYLLQLMGRDDAGVFIAEVETRIAGVIHVLVQDTPPILQRSRLPDPQPHYGLRAV
jgi:hypothetical protein